MTISYITGAQTPNNVSSDQIVQDVSKLVPMLQDSRAVLSTMIDKLDSVQGDSHSFKWQQDQIPERTVTVSGSINSSAASLVLTSSDPVPVGYQLYNKTSGEMLRVEANNTSTETLTVKRGVGTTAAATVADAEVLLIVSPAYNVGSYLYPAKTTVRETNTNYMQTFRTPVDIAAHNVQVKQYAGNQRDLEQAKAMLLHARSENQAFWFGQAATGTISSTESTMNAGKTVYYTGGYLSFLPSARKDSLTAFTETATTASLSTAFNNPGGKREMTAFCSRRTMAKLATMGYSLQKIDPGSNKMGLPINQYETGFGTINAVIEDAFTGFVDAFMVLVDVDSLQSRYLEKTHLVENVHAPDYHGTIDEFRSTKGLSCGHTSRGYQFNAIAA